MRIAQYEIIEELGRGGFGVVYKARDTRMGREVALKVITGGLTREKAFVERFQQEAQIAAGLRHPRIVPVYDFGDADGTLYLVMALVQGRTLRQLLDERKRLTLDQALPILAQLADALDYLGSQGLVHRDVKPANVLIEREDRDLGVTLTDFGLVRSLEASTRFTQTASVLGTPAYMAPEQAAPEKWGEVTPLTDVYALGIVTYEMLVGQPPFAGELATVLHAQVYDVPTPPLELAPDLGADLAQVLTRALRKPPAERYPNAGALVDTLRQVAEARTRQQVQQTELAQLLERADAARKAGDWLALQSLCVQMMQLDNTHSDALAMKAEATAGLQRENAEEAVRKQRARRYEEGEQALAAWQWREAISAFEEVAGGNPDFRDVQQKLARARDELQRALWYDEAIVNSEAGRWDEACRVWVKVLRGRLDYREGDAAVRFLDATKELLDFLDTVYAKLKRQQHELRQVRMALKRLSTTARDWMTWERDGKQMVRIPAGVFIYGNDEAIILPEFWIDKTPVTNVEYKRFLDANPKHPVPFVEASWAKPYYWDRKSRSFPPNKANHPVVLTSWADAVAYAKWAGKRLPTEQENGKRQRVALTDAAILGEIRSLHRICATLWVMTPQS